MSNNSIWPIDRTFSGATTSGQNGPRNDGNERVLCNEYLGYDTKESNGETPVQKL